MSATLDAGAARAAGIAGLIGVAGNLAAVALLADMPAAYRLARLDEWVTAVADQRAATTASAAAFVVGLIALAYWARDLGRRAESAAARAGAWLISVTALGNALGTVTPLVLANHVAPLGDGSVAVGRALLGLSLSLDALFNLGLGVGLLLVSAAQRGALRALMVLAGILTVPVAAQAVWDPAASGLYLAAPLWLGVVIWTSVRGLRRPA